MGDSGVGKTTMIASMANYLRFQSLREAVANSFMPIELVVDVTDENTRDDLTLSVGGEHAEPVVMKTKVGESITQLPQAYELQLRDCVIQIIDTPGFNSTTEGREKDEERVSDILTYIDQFKNLSLICIVVLASAEKFTQDFRHCIIKTLQNLNRNAQENVVFCLTHNSASYDYTTCPARRLIRRLLDEEKLNAINSNENAFYFFDNASMKCIVERILSKKLKLTESPTERFELAWRTSTESMKKLLRYALHAKSHSIRDSLSVNRSRQIIVKIAEPLVLSLSCTLTNKAGLIKTIQEKAASPVSRVGTVIHKLKLVCRVLPKYSLICRNSACATVCRGNLVYARVCHENCTSGFWPQLCKMMVRGKCSQCQCDAAQHKVSNYVIEMKEEIKTLSTARAKDSSELDETLAEMRREEEKFSKLLKAAASCSSFLRHNAIIKSRPVEDSIKSEIQKLRQNYDELHRKFKAKETEADIKDVTELENLFADEVRSNQKLVNCVEIEEVIRELCQITSYGNIFHQVITIGDGSPTTCIRFPDTVTLDCGQSVTGECV